jgi:hypothetical protein
MLGSGALMKISICFHQSDSFSAISLLLLVDLSINYWDLLRWTMMLISLSVLLGVILFSSHVQEPNQRPSWDWVLEKIDALDTQRLETTVGQPYYQGTRRADCVVLSN